MDAQCGGPQKYIMSPECNRLNGRYILDTMWHAPKTNK